MAPPTSPPPIRSYHASSYPVRDRDRDRDRNRDRTLSSTSVSTVASGTKPTMHRIMSSYSKRPPVTDEQAYSYALRAAYLAHLLQPRARRVQHVANTSKPLARTSTSNDMLKDFSLVRDSKSTRFPHAFMAALDKRLTAVLLDQDRSSGPEYKDPLVKRTFAAFLNEFKRPDFRKTVEQDRKVEGLLLIFFSRATSELQKGKAPDDDAWKWMVDRHVALFVRLISSTLHANDWTRDRPELSARLKTLETKLLQHDQDLADVSQRGGGQGGQSVEVEVPRSYDVKDMPLVIRVCRIFAKPTAIAQADIDAHRDVWTEKAALKDLKDYQNQMMLNTRVTLTKDDFDLDDAFDAWRKGEFGDLSQMMLAIVLSNPDLAKTNSSALVGLRSQQQAQAGATIDYGDASRQLSTSQQHHDSAYAIDQPVDMSGLNIDDSSPHDSWIGSADASQASFTFIPPDSHVHYRAVFKAALTHDLNDDDEDPTGEDAGTAMKSLLSKQSTDLMNEIALRWRIPTFTRLVLFLDVVREKFERRELPLDTLDAAFTFVKEPSPSTTKKLGATGPAAPMHQINFLDDRSRWTFADYALLKNILSTLRDELLRALYDILQHCYEPKPPSIGAIMYVLETHIDSDPLVTYRAAADNGEEGFRTSLIEALREQARSRYHELLSKHISDRADDWQFYNVIMLGKAVTALCDRIQKRYRRSPEVRGVNPLTILVEEVLPAFAEDARELVTRIMELGRQKSALARQEGRQEEQAGGGEVPIQDGFELYKELVEIRRVHAAALPGREFNFSIEGLLQDFVWRLLRVTDEKVLGWIESAVSHDPFHVRQSEADAEAGLPPTDEERHSQSAVDVYIIFHQAIEQIVKLEWDDDLQYAKFMTAVAKSIGKGVARYCELLEAQFAKEMDRQTPEQESRALQSQQQRWLTAARDFYSSSTSSGAGGGASLRNADKIQPFQFLPTSFVKINNIEYATLQLDRVEKELNVDACAEVIARLEPPPPSHLSFRPSSSSHPGQQSQKPKYTFTIKILEAEDLKAGDMNGLSDPYVVLGDEYQKRLAKTRTVYQSLNPRWDETVDILTSGALNIIATVWDWDLIGDHDCLGRTSLKLDPAHFSDYLPREYWLDLDTQGRVLVRVSMEGERDDVEFYFGKAFRGLKRCQRDMSRRVTEKLKGFVGQCLSRRTLRAVLAGSQGSALSSLGVGPGSMGVARGYFNKISSQVAGTGMGSGSGAVGTAGSAVGAHVSTATVDDAVSAALKPLLAYFDDNFAIMKQTLTETAMVMVMTRLWKEVLVTIESLLVPPLSDKLSTQKPLASREVDVVYRWLQILFDFFHAIDDESGQPNGVPLDVLKSPKYHDLQNLAFFYTESTDNLIRTSESMATATAARQYEANARLMSRPVSLGSNSNSFAAAFGSGNSPLRRAKSVLLSRNLGTMRAAKEAKRREAQAEPSDDMILRILRMRPEAEKYLRERSRQKERLAAAAAAEAIVRQSLMAGRGGGGGLMGGLMGEWRAGGASAGAGLGGRGQLSRKFNTIRE